MSGAESTLPTALSVEDGAQKKFLAFGDVVTLSQRLTSGVGGASSGTSTTGEQSLVVYVEGFGDTRAVGVVCDQEDASFSFKGGVLLFEFDPHRTMTPWVLHGCSTASQLLVSFHVG